MIDKETLEQYAIQGGTGWLKKVGLSDRFSKTERMVAKYLPRKYAITLPAILRFDGISVDWIIATMEAGAFTLPAQDWRKVLRNAMTKRLRANRVALSTPSFKTHVAMLLEYQAEGGKLSIKEELTNHARKVLLHPRASFQEQMTAKLFLSLCHETESYALTKSFHWLKMVLAAEEHSPLMGSQCYKKEDAAMKAAIIQALLTVDV
jgi:hypothetical protein